MERAPVSLRRVTYRDDGRVHYQGVKYHPRLGTDHQLVSAVEFLAMLVPHIMLRYEVTIRSYGAASTTFRRKAGWITEPPVNGPPPEIISASQILPGFEPERADQPGELGLDSKPPSTPGTSAADDDDEGDEFLRTRKRNWGKLVAKVWIDNPSLCTSCGKPMKIIAAIISPAQDDVIERVLRHLNLWDPPWKRIRRARGPPTSSSGQTPSAHSVPEPIDPPVDDELYFQDPIPEEDWTG